MAIVPIHDSKDLKAGDQAIFAPFGCELFVNSENTLDEKNGVLGFVYNETNFFPVTTRDGELVEHLVLVEAYREEPVHEKEEHVGKEVRQAADLTADYGVLVILRHPKHGDYRGFASRDDIDGYEYIHVINGKGRGSFQFFISDGYTIHLAVGLNADYNL